MEGWKNGKRTRILLLKRKEEKDRGDTGSWGGETGFGQDFESFHEKNGLGFIRSHLWESKNEP